MDIKECTDGQHRLIDPNANVPAVWSITFGNDSEVLGPWYYCNRHLADAIARINTWYGRANNFTISRL